MEKDGRMNNYLFVVVVAATSVLLHQEPVNASASMAVHSFREVASLGTQATPPTPADNTSPLQVSSVALAGAPPVITFDVVNTSLKAVTAWQADVIFDGRRYIKGQDDYDNFANGRPAKAYILPASRFPVTLTLPPTTSASSVPKVTLIGAIFADRTFVGDSKWADTVFQTRAANLIACNQVVQEFEQLLQLTDVTTDALNSTLSRLESASQLDQLGDSPRLTARSHIRMLIADAKTNPAKVRPRLEYFLTLAMSSQTAAAANVR
jgi:hypothetical protein